MMNIVVVVVAMSSPPAPPLAALSLTPPSSLAPPPQEALSPVAPPPPTNTDPDQILVPSEEAALVTLQVNFTRSNPCGTPGGNIVCDGGTNPPHRVVALSLEDCPANALLSSAALLNFTALASLSFQNCPMLPDLAPLDFTRHVTTLVVSASLGRTRERVNAKKLPADWVANFTELTTLSISDVELDDSKGSGLFPITRSLPKVLTLIITSTSIGGPLPKRTWPPSIDHIDVSLNKIEGSIPLELYRYTSLRHFDAHGNELDGALHPDIRLLSGLRYLDISGSGRITGSIPSEIGELSELRHLDLSNNNFSGTIPASMSGLAHLSFLNLAGNKLSGRIPESFSGLLNISTINLSNNKLMGSIPLNLTFLTNLVSLDLSSNALTGEIPFNDTFLAQLETLNLGQNPGLCYNDTLVKQQHSKLLAGIRSCSDNDNNFLYAPVPSPLGLPSPPSKLSSKRTLDGVSRVIVVVVVIILFLAAIVVLFCCIRCCRRRSRERDYVTM